jgi:hypothetical protein
MTPGADSGANAMPNAGIPEHWEATSRAVRAADQLHAWESIRTGDSKRRGLLQRLTHPDPSAGEEASGEFTGEWVDIVVPVRLRPWPDRN